MEKTVLVAIMAHNEQKVIEDAVRSCIAQSLPTDFNMLVLVVANACSDQTEEVVQCLQHEHPNLIELISVPKKGKTRALNIAVEFVHNSIADGTEIPFVIFFDADCVFKNNDNLCAFLRRFESEPSLEAVAAETHPITNSPNSSYIVRQLYLSIDNLDKKLHRNTISGMAYCVCSGLLHKEFFPHMQMADDLFVSAKLDGWFDRSSEAAVFYRIPRSIKSELNKRVRQEVSNIRFTQYQDFQWKQYKKRLALHDSILAEEYRWAGYTRKDLIRAFLVPERLADYFFNFINYAIRRWAVWRASQIAETLKHRENVDYWHVER